MEHISLVHISLMEHISLVHISLMEHISLVHISLMEHISLVHISPTSLKSSLRGVLQSSLHRNEDSIASFTRALASRPWLAQAHLGLASSLFKAGRSKEATAVLEECVMVGNAPAKDGCAHQWAVTTCRQRLARSYILDQKPGGSELFFTVGICTLPINH